MFEMGTEASGVILIDLLISRSFGYGDMNMGVTATCN